MQKFMYLTTQNSKVREKGYSRHYLQSHCLLLVLCCYDVFRSPEWNKKKRVEENNCRESGKNQKFSIEKSTGLTKTSTNICQV